MSFADNALSRRRALAALAVGAIAPGVLAACGSRGGPLSGGDDAPEQPTISFEPADAAREVNPTAPVTARVTDGTFQTVALTNPDGKVVAGELNPERTGFTVTEPLGYGVTYTWSGTVSGADGTATVPVAGAFTTLAPTRQVNGRFQLADGQTVGVAVPIILQFNAAIPEPARAAVEKALTVTTTPQVEGGWAWLPDEVGGSRVHWRSREYFPAGTAVHVDANLYGVPFGEGAYGAGDSTLDFSIGRRQVVKADAPSHRIQVLDGAGAVIMDFPCSYGEGDLDRNVTRSGIHVVTEKYEDFYMTNPAAGYANVHMRHAVRISNNGEFIHANPGSSGAQGNSNVTNGCINLSAADAEAFFDSVVYGDPVEVTGTRIQLSYADGDLWDWAVPWDEWVAMSALSEQKTPNDIPSTAPVTPSQAPQPAGARPGG